MKQNYCIHRSANSTLVLVIHMLVIERMTIIPRFLAEQQLSSLWDPRKESPTGDAPCVILTGYV